MSESYRNQNLTEKPNSSFVKWLTGDEVTQILRVSKRTLQNYRDQREISFYQIGRKIYYKSIDVDEFLERYHIKSKY